MKKSFMTRALATGLSLAMAFSLSAATNVTTAEAASLMKASSKTVTEGKTVTTYMTSSQAKKYRIKSHKESTVAKKYISVAMLSSRKGLKITAKEGALAAVNLEKKGVNVKINFVKASSAAAAKKATKIAKTANLKVVVKAKAEEKMTMTAEATGVKKIAVNFSKAVDTTTTKIVVKKGSATPAITATTYATDAKSAELAMGAKLTEGTYTVEVTTDKETLTADIAVKDEAMTAFKLVSTNLVAKPAPNDKDATISFKAVNQYGEPMNASNLSVSCSFGSETTVSTNPTTDKNGVITVKGIVDALRIDGQTGTLVLVNKDNGVNLNETVTYRTKAVAAAANVLGIYSTKTEKVIDGNIKVGDTVSQYKVLVNIQDQYGSDMDVSAIADSGSEVTLNPANVLTDLTVPVAAKAINQTNQTSFEDVTYDGKSCIAIPLEANSSTVEKSGTLTLTMVGANKGVLATPSFTVDDVVVIQSVSISAADTIYDGSEAKLIVDAVDVNGNAVTKYEDLKAAFKDTFEKDAQLTLKKNTDGTGTFYYTPSNVFTSNTEKQNTSLPVPKMFYANDAASGKYIVKPVNFTVFEAKTPVSVSSLASDAVTAVANVTGAALEFNLDKVTVEDQYANTIKYADLNADEKTSITAYLKDDKGIFGGSNANVSFTDGIAEFTTVSTTTGNATLYLKYNTSKAGGNKDAVSEDKYDYKVTLSVVDVSNVTASDLTLKVNDGKSVYGGNPVEVEPQLKAVTATSDYLGTKVTCSAVLTAKVAGKNVVIPTDMYTITDGKTLGDYKKVDTVVDGKTVAEKTEEKTVTVVFGDSGKEVVSAKVTVSNANAKAVEIKKADSNKVASVGTALASAIKFVDQYGNDINVNADEIIYNITFTGKNADTLQKKVKKNATQAVGYDGTVPAGSTASVTYTYSGITFTTDVEF